MGLDGAPVKSLTFKISPLKLRPPTVARWIGLDGIRVGLGIEHLMVQIIYLKLV